MSVNLPPLLPHILPPAPVGLPSICRPEGPAVTVGWELALCTRNFSDSRRTSHSRCVAVCARQGAAFPGHRAPLGHTLSISCDHRAPSTSGSYPQHQLCHTGRRAPLSHTLSISCVTRGAEHLWVTPPASVVSHGAPSAFGSHPQHQLCHTGR
ncbi:hypothetical protein ACOMHN_053513 [Nucella lapillus]